jgi:hypothetical protein
MVNSLFGRSISRSTPSKEIVACLDASRNVCAIALEVFSVSRIFIGYSD